MKRYALMALMLMFTLTVVWQPAEAADLKVKATQSPKVKSKTSTTFRMSASPLKGVVKLTPSLRMRAKAKKMSLPVKLEQLYDHFVEMAAYGQTYEVGVATMPELQKHCADKSYSVQDQIEAGCNGNETLNQCMEKLVSHCMASYSTPGLDIGGWGGVTVGGVSVGGYQGTSVPEVSVEAFREAAEQTAAQAKSLSRKINQYARQAERNANAWK